MLYDSNIVIYTARPEHVFLRDVITEDVPVVSAISRVEVLGFHGLDEVERGHLEAFFAAAVVLPITDAVVEHAIALRQARKMSLGGAIVAATALVHGLMLVTRNTSDFIWVPSLRVWNPFDASRPPEDG